MWASGSRLTAPSTSPTFCISRTTSSSCSSYIGPRSRVLVRSHPCGRRLAEEAGATRACDNPGCSLATTVRSRGCGVLSFSILSAQPQGSCFGFGSRRSLIVAKASGSGGEPIIVGGPQPQQQSKWLVVASLVRKFMSLLFAAVTSSLRGLLNTVDVALCGVAWPLDTVKLYKAHTHLL